MKSLRHKVFTWYDSHGRNLPWRVSRDPYRIWLSEIMLQQTRVGTVLAYYPMFLDQFPNIKKLAAAPLERVLAAWSGLGYYRRARHLHRAAQEIVDRHQGCIPATVAELRALPGVGRYTSAAIASIAFGVPVAVVDGNVERVLSRFQNLATDRKIDYWTVAEWLLDRKRPGDWNQAMMELGATLCLPREPRCDACPLSRWCHWSPSVYHKPRAALPARRQRQEAYLLARRGRSVYLVRRAPEAKLMGGMWELPHLPAPPAGREPLFRLKHSITFTDYAIAVFDSVDKPTGGRWVAFASIPELPLTGLARKVLRRAGLI